MSRLNELAGRVGLRRRSRAGTSSTHTVAAANGPGAEPPRTEDAEMRKQRDRLLEKFTIMQADLGGAFYEMAIRDHVRVDVLTAKAAELQQVDSELLALERLLELDRKDAAGLCAACGAPYGHSDRFCPQCGSSLVPREAAT
jgi:NADH pyrophosphatase NudC (nudix superfamily)